MDVRGYELHERIGSGGFGVVHRAYQSTVGREVAIKIILPHFANQPDFIRRFEIEAQLVARLEHLHIVPLYDYWRDPDGAYLVMRLLRGGNLKSLLANGPFELAGAAKIVEQLAAGLSAAHRNGVIHRDIKPSNILMDEDGNAYLSDFGIAKDLSRYKEQTESDIVKGSPGYLSPEQARSEPVSERTDVYSLGVVLYEMLCGEHPFPDANPVERIYKHLNEPLPLLSDLDHIDESVIDSLNEIIQKATEKNPLHRYADALEFAAALRQQGAAGQGYTPGSIVEQLTRREQEILQLIIDGLSNQEIADRLYIAIGTVKWYNRQIYKKLHVRNRVQAIHRARELDFVFGGVEVDEDSTSYHTYVTLPEPENPYKGLQAFQVADARDFFGRDKIIQKLVNHLGGKEKSARFLTVVGPSGSGKSSLVKAGLIPALLRGDISGSERWFIADMIPGARPLDELEIALTRVANTGDVNLNEQLTRDENGLLRLASLLLPDDDSELVIVIDQFEEVFTLVPDEERRTQFLDLLQAAVTDPRSRVRVVVTLRADFYDRPLHYPEFGELVRNCMETVLPLSAHELEQAIIKPAEHVGVTFEDGLVPRMIDEVLYQPGALPLLQYALTELFEHRDGRKLTYDAYQTIGGTIGALAKRADALFEEQDDTGKALVRQLFLRLVTLGEGTEDTRRRATQAELLSLTDDPDLMDEIIAQFADYRLLLLDHDPNTRAPTVEVAHEAILREWERLRGWLNESRDDIKMQRQLGEAAQRWQAGNRDEGHLLRSGPLQDLERWGETTRLSLTPIETEYLQVSLKDRERRQQLERERQAREVALTVRARRILRGLVAVFLIAAVVSAGLAILAGDRANAAEKASREADEARQEALKQAAIGLASQAEGAMDAGNQDLAVLLALEALEHYPHTWQARTTLATLVTRYVPAWSISFRPDTATINSVEWSHDGKWIAYSTPRSVVIVDTDSKTILWSSTNEPNRRATSAVQWLPDGSLATVLPVEGSDSYQLAIQSVLQQSILRELEIPDIVNDMALSPDGSTLALGTESGTIYTWNLERELELEIFVQHTGPVRSLSWSRDSLLLTVSSDDKNILVWDIDSKELTTIDSGHAAPLLQVAWSPVDQHLATVSTDGSVRVRDMQSEEVLATLPVVTLSKGDTAGVHDDLMTEIVWSNDGQSLAINSNGDQIDVWQLESQKIMQQFKGNSVIFAMTWSPDNQEIVYIGFDITAFEVSAHSPALEEHPGNQFSARWSPDGQFIASSGYSNNFQAGDLMIYDAETLEVIHHLVYPGGGLSHFGWSPDSTKIVTGSIGDTVVWDRESGQKLYTFEIPAEEQWAQIADWSPDGNFIVLGSKGAVRLIDAATGNELFTIPLDCWGTSPSFSPDSQHVVTGCGDAGNPNARKDVIIWSTQTGQIERIFSDHADYTLATAWSNDGTMIVSGDDTGRVLIWKADTGEINGELTGHSGKVNGVSWSSDDSMIAATSFDGTSIIWEIASQKPVQIFRYEGISGRPYFSPDDDVYLLISHTNTGKSATLHRVWKTTDELLYFARNCCVVRELTPAERDQFGLPAHD